MEKKKILWGIISFIIALLTIWAVMSQSKNASPAMIWNFIKGSNKVWMLLSALSMFGFIWFEGYAIIRIARSLGYKNTVRQGTLYGAADVYFSAITPSATGGQPASAYFMIKDGMPAHATTVVLLINLIMYTLALLTLGILSIIFFPGFLMRFSWISKLLILIGSVVLILLAIAFYFLLRRGEFLRKFCDKLMKILKKFHLVRYNERRQKKLNDTMEKYQECSRILVGKRKMLLEVYFWNLMQRLSQFGVSVCVFMATGAGALKALKIGVIQCFVSLGSNSVPIPGSMGVADYIMLDGFKMIVGEAQPANMELICRGIAFYGSVITGLLIVIIGYLSRQYKKN